MSLIITATDFSDIATNAVNYACNLAKNRNADVIILHSYSVPLMFSDVPMPVTFINDTQQDAESHMSALVDGLHKSFPGLNISGSVVFGDIIDVIEDYAESSTTPWMIVVGNSSSTDQPTWPDSTLTEAFKSLKYPVLAIPPGAAYKPIANICFAFDNKHNGNISAMLQLTDITQQVGAQLHVINARSGNDHKDTEIDPIAKNLLSPVNPSYDIVIDKNIDHAIETFIEANNVDMLVMIPRKHSFFEGLFHRSHTKAVATRSHVPMLALHDSQA